MRTRSILGVLIATLLCVIPVIGYASQSFEELLQEADKVRSSDPKRFSSMLEALDSEVHSADPLQRQKLQYLHVYSMVVYDNKLDLAVEQAKTLFDQTADIDLKFRTGSLIANSYAISRNFGDGLRYLDQTLPLRRAVTQKDVRHDGIDTAATLYNQLGQYKLGLHFAEETLSDRPNPRTRCFAGYLRLEALFNLGKLPADDTSIMGLVTRCGALGERIAANYARAVLARKWAAQGRRNEAISLLQTHLADAESTGYSGLIGEMHSLLAELLLLIGDVSGAEAHASAAIAQSAGNANSMPLVMAHKVMYEIAVRRRDPVAALAHYRRYAEADKAHLNDVKARELVYQIASQENAQKTQQIELLDQQNQLLQLQQRIDKQASQNTHLLVVLLTFLVAGIGYWAYKIKRVQMSLRRFAETDALTNISNRHHFSQQAELALAYSAKAGEPCALIMFDLDHFKAINDGYGHDTGDWVLKRVAETCKGHCRKIDHLGRLGGEEFAILLQGVDLRTATRLAEDCRVRIAQIDTRESGFTFVVTASFGVSASPLSGYGLRQLLSHADQMLYCAKRGGRNRVHAYLGDTLNPPQLQVVSRNDDLAARRDGALSADGAAENLG